MTLSDTEADQGIHVIARDNEEQYPQNEAMDTPTFLQSLEMQPNDTGTTLLDSIGADGGHSMADFGLSPNFGSFPEYPDSIDPKGNIHDVGDSTNFAGTNHVNGIQAAGATSSMNGALTKLGPLLPLPQLSDPVINNLQIPGPSVLSNYLQNGVGGVGSVGAISRAAPQLLPATKKKKPATAAKQPPAFIQKMWLMVNDPANHAYIRWSDDGESFLVAHREEFMKSILPKYFKHNNFASFVRQLNMYGWHKVQDVTSGLLKDERNPEEVFQFKNPLFLRGREDLLESIVRNRSGGSESENAELNLLNLQLVINELELIKMNQLAIIEDMRRMRNDNKLLWNESFSARERHLKQTETLEKIMKFLAAVYGNSAGKVFEVEDRFDQNYDNVVSPYKTGNKGSRNNNSNSHGSYASQPFQKPRLMLMDQAHHQTPEEPKNGITTVEASAVQTPSDTNSPLNVLEPESDVKRGSSTIGRKSSIALAGKDVIEEITRTSPDLSHGDANKVFQQIMNLDSSLSSPQGYLADFAQLFNGNNNSNPQETPIDKNSFQEGINGLEQNIYRQGQALLHVQELIQQLADRQNQQQEELQQHKQKQDLISLTPGSGEDFNVEEFLSSHPIDLAVSSNKTPLATRSKRHIEEVDDDSERSKKTKSGGL